MKDFIEVKNLSYSYGDFSALENIFFKVAKEQIIAIIGPNGSGKTTLLKNLIGLYSPSKGEILIAGKKPFDYRKNIGYVPQRFDFDRQTPITVKEFMGLERCSKHSHSLKNIKKVLQEVGADKLEKQQLSSLSGGQFQRVMIARSLLHEKELLIFDEPATGIDMAGEHTIYDLILKINKERKTTCIIVSHELNVVNKYAEKVLCLNKSMVCYGQPEVVINEETLHKLYGVGAGLYHSH
ncbi:MAG: metal ABC transporter ATP-binding protein [Candidatus Pacebacteria bacterium]|nr:metal ABC transporter ATP-binding protein [Candidatus Paceibacterota bacterium]